MAIPKPWKNAPGSETTPISAENLNDMEERLAALTEGKKLVTGTGKLKWTAAGLESEILTVTHGLSTTPVWVGPTYEYELSGAGRVLGISAFAYGNTTFKVRGSMNIAFGVAGEVPFRWLALG